MPKEPAGMTTAALEQIDDEMLTRALSAERMAPEDMRLWSAALKELDKRGRVKLTHGSYDDVANALIQRLRDAGSD